ncbi:hypothetical protein RFI_19074, partial [Reticulomyxa filosa]
MQPWNWAPIENEYVIGTVWKPTGAPQSVDNETIEIPKDFENLFRKSKLFHDYNNYLQCDCGLKQQHNTTQHSINKNTIQTNVGDKTQSGTIDEEKDRIDSIGNDPQTQEEGLIMSIGPWREKHVRDALSEIALPSTQIRAYILDADDTKLGRTVIDKLLTIIPQTEEIKFVLHKVNTRQMKTSDLTDVELFFYYLADMELLEVKLKLWQSKLK